MEYLSSDNPISPANCMSKEKKKNGKTRSKVVKLSTDPQSVAARERRHRISDKFKILQSMVPGGTKMDTVSMLEEAIHYVKFLKAQIWLHQSMINSVDDDPFSLVNIPSCGSLPADQGVLCPLINRVDAVEHMLQLPPSESYFHAEQTLSCDALVYEYLA